MWVATPGQQQHWWMTVLPPADSPPVIVLALQTKHLKASTKQNLNTFVSFKECIQWIYKCIYLVQDKSVNKTKQCSQSLTQKQTNKTGRHKQYGWTGMVISTSPLVNEEKADWSFIRGSFCGGSFFLTCEDFGRMFNHSFPTCAIFFFGSRDKLANTNSTL